MAVQHKQQQQYGYNRIYKIGSIERQVRCDSTIFNRKMYKHKIYANKHRFFSGRFLASPLHPLNTSLISVYNTYAYPE